MDMGEQRKVLLTQTVLPIGAVAAAIVVIIGGVAWLTNVAGSVGSLNARMTNMESSVLKLQDNQNAVTERLASIEAKIDLLIKDRK